MGRGDFAAPLTWQQEARLVNERDHGAYPNLGTFFRIPDHISDADFYDSLGSIVQREDALRTVGASLADGGACQYATRITPPVCGARVRSAAEATAFAQTRLRHRLARDGGPLWEATIITCSGAGEAARFAALVFDHLVCDGRSLELIQAELVGGPAANAGMSGSYADWAGEQRRRYALGAVSASRDFWLRHLDGTPADRDTPLPFAKATAPHPGGVHTTIQVDAPLPVSVLEMASKRAGVTPFLAVLAVVASTVSRAGAGDDLTLRVIGMGRPFDHLFTVGWFADSLPLRLRGSRLESTAGALAAISEIWPLMLDHQESPWEYIWRTSASEGLPTSRYARRQLVVNYVSGPAAPITPATAADRTAAVDIDGCHLLVTALADRCELRLLFNPEDFEVAPARRFLEWVAARLVDFSHGSFSHGSSTSRAVRGS